MSDSARYAAIDRHSGFVMGDAVAATMQAAAVAIMEQVDTARYGADVVGRRDETATLDLYRVAADLVIEDGQNRATIDAVMSRYAGSVRTYDLASARD